MVTCISWSVVFGLCARAGAVRYNEMTKTVVGSGTGRCPPTSQSCCVPQPHSSPAHFPASQHREHWRQSPFPPRNFTRPPQLSIHCINTDQPSKSHGPKRQYSCFHPPLYTSPKTKSSLPPQQLAAPAAIRNCCDLFPQQANKPKHHIIPAVERKRVCIAYSPQPACILLPPLSSSPAASTSPLPSQASWMHRLSPLATPSIATEGDIEMPQIPSCPAEHAPPSAHSRMPHWGAGSLLLLAVRPTQSISAASDCFQHTLPLDAPTFHLLPRSPRSCILPGPSSDHPPLNTASQI